MYIHAKRTFGSIRRIAIRRQTNKRSVQKTQKCKTGITDMNAKLEKDAGGSQLLSLFFQSGDSSEPPPSFRRLGGRLKNPKRKTNGCNPLR